MRIYDMIAPLEFIFGGGGDGSDGSEKENQSGGAADVFTKNCSEIKNKYGVPIGYSCIITQKINDSASAPDEIEEISDDNFDRLFERATENTPTSRSARAAPPRKTRRYHRADKSKRATKKRAPKK